MTAKQYKIARIITIILVAFTVSTSLSLGNFVVPILIIIAGMALMYSWRKKMEKQGNVLADERDYQIAGNAARYTLTIYGALGAIATMVLMVLGKQDHDLLLLGYFFAYTVTGLLLFNALLFKLLNRKSR